MGKLDFTGFTEDADAAAALKMEISDADTITTADLNWLLSTGAIYKDYGAGGLIPIFEYTVYWMITSVIANMGSFITMPIWGRSQTSQPSATHDAFDVYLTGDTGEFLFPFRNDSDVAGFQLIQVTGVSTQVSDTVSAPAIPNFSDFIKDNQYKTRLVGNGTAFTAYIIDVDGGHGQGANWVITTLSVVKFAINSQYLWGVGTYNSESLTRTASVTIGPLWDGPEGPEPPAVSDLLGGGLASVGGMIVPSEME